MVHAASVARTSYFDGNDEDKARARNRYAFYVKRGYDIRVNKIAGT